VRSAWCDINLGAIERNARALAGLAGVPLLPIVKANAYGHGVGPVVERLEQLPSVWGVGVVLVAEATRLRELGYQGRIVIPGGLIPEQAAEAVDSRSIIALSDLAVARAIDREARGRGEVAVVHLKVDVGMHRLGFPLAEAESAAAEIAACEGLRLEGLLTHLAAAHAGDEDSRARTAREIALFADLADRLRHRYPDLVTHAANSSALMAAGGSAFDLARPGLAVYGWKPAGWLPDSLALEPALGVHSRVVVEKVTGTGARVGYSQTPVAADRRLGVLPIGYADGIPAQWGLRDGYVLFATGRAPLVGSVSMDSCVVDLTELPDEGPGSIALVLGTGAEGLIDPHEPAAATGRSVYEMLVALNGRLPRRHHD
jgi:alanine racemase